MNKESNTTETAIDTNRVLPAVFDSVEQAVEILKLDKRHKWENWHGYVAYPTKSRACCNYCDGSGCYECNYKGFDLRDAHMPAFMPDWNFVNVAK